VAQDRVRLLSYSDLLNWNEDNHQAALKPFLETCPKLTGVEWRKVCSIAEEIPNARLFFETFFYPILIENGETALFTGYFEPELKGSLQRTSRFKYPIYAPPPKLPKGKPWLSRKQIEQTNTLAGRGLELAWVDEPIDVFFLHIQGSGRVIFQDDETIRIGYKSENGHPYRSIGKELVRQKILRKHEVSVNRIRSWARNNPKKAQRLMWHNPSYVFFRLIEELPEKKGPLGAMNRSITAMRSLAIDPRYVKLGAPVWMEKGGPRPLNRLMIAQDTGAAIKGPQRADIYFGTGDDAGIAAGLTRATGRLVVLLPIKLALDKVSGF
jgi:membrane-bound lytic murein transglycosylase A